MNPQRGPWVVVLAGGDGLRLKGATVLGRTLDRPKQFCSFRGATSLLRETLERAEHITDRSRILAVVRDDHCDWWLHELDGLPGENVLTQAGNRGTAVAILHALVHVLARDSEPTLVILPSDHAVDAEAPLLDSIQAATAVAGGSREQVVLLGVTPEHAESDYGWILPGRSNGPRCRRVNRFVEKPAADLAAELFAQGALWNSFISAITGHVLLDLFEKAQPVLLDRYLEWSLARSGSGLNRDTLFAALPFVDFSRDILQAATSRLSVVSVPPCGWTDLGTPRRVEQWLRRAPSPVPARRAGVEADRHFAEQACG